MVRREKANYVIQSVSHALDVLEQFNGTVDEIGVTELSKRLKLHKNNVFRLLATLEARSYIEQNKASENYRLGLKCLQLGQTFIHQMGLLLQSKAVLVELSKATQESAYVAIRKSDAIIPLDFVEPERPVRVVSFLGTVLPAHCTAAGKAHLTFENLGFRAEPIRLRAAFARQTPSYSPDRSSEGGSRIRHPQSAASRSGRILIL
jgi:IclR family KDG regulon transcriptional repressor